MTLTFMPRAEYAMMVTKVFESGVSIIIILQMLIVLVNSVLAQYNSIISSRKRRGINLTMYALEAFLQGMMPDVPDNVALANDFYSPMELEAIDAEIRASESALLAPVLAWRTTLAKTPSFGDTLMESFCWQRRTDVYEPVRAAFAEKYIVSILSRSEVFGWRLVLDSLGTMNATERYSLRLVTAMLVASRDCTLSVIQSRCYQVMRNLIVWYDDVPLLRLAQKLVPVLYSSVTSATLLAFASQTGKLEYLTLRHLLATNASTAVLDTIFESLTHTLGRQEARTLFIEAALADSNARPHTICRAFTEACRASDVDYVLLDRFLADSRTAISYNNYQALAIALSKLPDMRLLRYLTAALTDRDERHVNARLSRYHPLRFATTHALATIALTRRGGGLRRWHEHASGASLVEHVDGDARHIEVTMVVGPVYDRRHVVGVEAKQPAQGVGGVVAGTF